MKLGQRFALLWGAIKNVFTGRGVTLTRDIKVSVDRCISVEHWVKKDGKPWRHVALTFDFVNPAKGYIDGELVSGSAAKDLEEEETGC